MPLLSKLLRYFLVLVGIALFAILVFAWKVGLFSTIPFLQLKIPEGPIEPHMYELRDLYQRGSGIDDAVSAFILEHKDVFLEPTIDLLGRSTPDTKEEEKISFVFTPFNDIAAFPNIYQKENIKLLEEE